VEVMASALAVRPPFQTRGSVSVRGLVVVFGLVVVSQHTALVSSAPCKDGIFDSP
jgi:hypothetical protein